MEYVVGAFFFVLFGGIIWVALKTFFGRADYVVPEEESSLAVQPERRSSSGMHVSRVVVAVPAEVIDLRVPDGISCAVAGISHWVDDDTKWAFSDDKFYLRREPTNEYDSSAIAVYGGTRKFGYLSASRAERYAPLFDEFGAETFAVARDLTRPRMSFLLPKIGDMRAAAKSHREE